MRGPASAPLRVLIVDDNADAASSLAFLTRSWGHDVRVAHDGLAALAAAADFRPDAILLDIGLPKLDGFAVARHLRSLPDFARTFIVATSGYGRDKDRRRAAEVGFDLYLVKPYNPWRLEELLAGYRPDEALTA
jgi:CheY-like chemotaxis protein